MSMSDLDTFNLWLNLCVQLLSLPSSILGTHFHLPTLFPVSVWVWSVSLAVRCPFLRRSL